MDGTEEAAAAMAAKKDDAMLAITILVVAVVSAVLFGLSLWRSKRSKSQWKEKSLFKAPQERDTYVTAKATADLKDPAQRDKLKKLLMKRAIRVVPLIMQLQNEGQSVERLYRKGMLTDDVHSKAKELRVFVEKEVPECQAEANELADGWGEVFWNQAVQIAKTVQQQTEDSAPEALAPTPAVPTVPAVPAAPAAPATVEETEEQQKKKAEAAKRKEKDKKRADRLAAMRDIGTQQADAALVGGGEDPAADAVARELIEAEAAEKRKATKKGARK